MDAGAAHVYYTCSTLALQSTSSPTCFVDWPDPRAYLQRIHAKKPLPSTLFVMLRSPSFPSTQDALFYSTSTLTPADSFFDFSTRFCAGAWIHFFTYVHCGCKYMHYY